MSMRAAVVGASGYTGLELIRILLRHPGFELTVITSEQNAGKTLGEYAPGLAGLTDLTFEAVDVASIAKRVDFVFTALPHTTSAPVVKGFRDAGLPVVDLSADFRLRDLSTYEEWYAPHPAPELLDTAVYGLPEVYREDVRKAQLVAAPGCYPTSVLLPLLPFLRAGVIEPGPIFVDSKSGTSGAGKKLAANLLFAEADSNCSTYAVGGKHRHVPEMEQEASVAAGTDISLVFTPHLLPTIRGIVTSVYLTPQAGFAQAQADAILNEAYADETFVRVLPQGTTPSLAAVRGSNFCDVQAVVDGRTGTLLLLSAIDNLVKGSGGQAVQCANLMLDLPESTGLLEAPLIP